MSKGTIRLVHLYPREMSIYGDLGNTRCLAARLAWHGYTPEVIDHHPGERLRDDAHILVGGGGQDSGQVQVEEDVHRNGETLAALADDGAPMLMICGMYQMLGRAFVTVDGQRVEGLGILDVTTTGQAVRMVGPSVLETEYGLVVGYENHSGRTELGDGQAPFGTVRHGAGNNGRDATGGARTGNVIGCYLHGPVLPSNPALADALIAAAVERALGRPFEPGEVDDTLAHAAHAAQVRRLLGRGDATTSSATPRRLWAPVRRTSRG